MLEISSAQLDAWVAMFMYPLARILALLATAPAFNNAVLPARMRLILGFTICLAIVPVLPPLPAIPNGSWLSIAIVVREILIGTLMGFSLRIVFSAIDLAGELIGMQMGLSFATAYDPQTAGQTPVITEFLALLATLIFFATNGHLLTLSLLAESFTTIPIAAGGVPAESFRVMMTTGGVLFSMGLLLSLPLIASLLIANIGLGILARVAAQLNLFSLGFAITLGAGMMMMSLSLPYIGAALERLFELAFVALGQLMQTLQTVPIKP